MRKKPRGRKGRVDKRCEGRKEEKKIIEKEGKGETGRRKGEKIFKEKGRGNYSKGEQN